MIDTKYAAVAREIPAARRRAMESWEEAQVFERHRQRQIAERHWRLLRKSRDERDSPERFYWKERFS